MAAAAEVVVAVVEGADRVATGDVVEGRTEAAGETTAAAAAVVVVEEGGVAEVAVIVGRSTRTRS